MGMLRRVVVFHCGSEIFVDLGPCP